MSAFIRFFEERKRANESKLEPASKPTQFNPNSLPYKYKKLYDPENKYDNKNELKDNIVTKWSYFNYLYNIHPLNLVNNSSDEFILDIWGLNKQIKNNDETARNELLNINSVEDKKNQKLMGENDGHNQNKKSTTIIPDAHIKQSKEIIAKFLNILFNKEKDTIKIKGKLMNHKELWKYIRTEVGNYYEIESKEILIFCKLKCMSLPPFLDAFEYHTGIKLNWGMVEDKSNIEKNKIEIEESLKNQGKTVLKNYTNSHLLNIVWKPEDILEISPKTKTFSFNDFVSNKKEYKDKIYICNFSQLIINRNLKHIDKFDKFMLLRFFYERINKTNNFSLWYILFFNLLKCESLEKVKDNRDLRDELDKGSNNSDSPNDERTNKNQVYNKNNECINLYKYIFEELSKSEQANKNTRYDLTGLLDTNIEDENSTNKNTSLYMLKKFSRLGYIMINLTEEIKNTVAERSQSLLAKDKDGLREFKEGNQDQLQFNYEMQAKDLIENFYIKDHPYYCDIKELCGKELLNRWNESNRSRTELEGIIENYFQEAIETGLKCLSQTNIYLANIALDVGTFYAARNDYLNAVKIFNWAYLPFKNNSQYFPKDYKMFLKRFIKYNIKLGDFRTALKLGEELIKENQSSRTEKDETTKYLAEHLHMQRIIYNLALIALKVKDYEKGIGYCQNIFEKKDPTTNNNNEANSNNKVKQKTEYINWQKGKENDYPGKELSLDDKDYNAKLEAEEDHIKLKLYMKMIIRSLDQDSQDNKNNKKIYLQAILRFYDSAEGKQSIKDEKPDLKEIISALKGNGNLKDYFKSKIFPALKTKNTAEDSSNDKTQIKEKEQNSDYELFKKLFSYFKKDKVFYSFDKKRKKAESKDDDNGDIKDDEKDGKNMKEDDGKNDMGDDDPGEDSQDEQQSNFSRGFRGNKTGLSDFKLK